MGFLIRHDYDQLISQTDLDVIIDQDDHILDEVMRSTQSEIKSYLSGRFDVDQMFFHLTEYKVGQTYEIGTIIVLVADDWANNIANSYVVGDLVAYDVNGGTNVFRCIQNTTNAKEQPSDPAYWVEIGIQDQLYNVTAQAINQNPNDTNYFTPRDPRNQHLVQMFVDVLLYHLHSRINPRNIPEFRISRRDDVISYLKMVADPRKNIQPDFPLLDKGTDKGHDITFGKSDQTSFRY